MSAPRHVAIVCQSTIEIESRAPFSTPLPGSETAALHLAMALSERGHEVEFFARCQPANLRGVLFSPCERLDARPPGCFDVVIWLRDYHLADRLQRLGRHNILFTLDSVRDLQGLFHYNRSEIASLLDALVSRFDTVCCASEWHVSNWQPLMKPELRSKLVAIYNYSSHVLAVPRFERRDMKRIVSTAHPRKSLRSVARIMRHLRDAGDWTCDYYGSPGLYQDADCVLWHPAHAQGSSQFRETFSQFAARHRDVVHFRPSLPLAGIDAALVRYGVFLHPDYSEETGSTVTIEAIQKGLVPVVSSVGALPELVADGGIVIAGDPLSEEFCARVAEVIASLDEERHAEIFSRQEPLRARYSAEAITRRWETILFGEPTG